MPRELVCFLCSETFVSAAPAAALRADFARRHPGVPLTQAVELCPVCLAVHEARAACKRRLRPSDTAEVG